MAEKREKEVEDELISQVKSLQIENKQLKDNITNSELKYQELEKEFIKFKKYISNFLKIILMLILIFSIIFLVVKIRTNNTQEIIYLKVQDYSSFVENWNEQVRNITDNKNYLLSFSKNSANIEKLNNLLQNFYITEITDSVKYNKFLEKNKFSKAFVLNNRMKEEELLKTLKDATNETIMSGIVKKMIIMNSEKYWKEHQNDN